jgi:hypothetical protein
VIVGLAAKRYRTTIIRSSSLRWLSPAWRSSVKRRSLKRNNLTGRRFGRLKVIRPIRNARADSTGERSRIYSVCLCDCGVTISVRNDHLLSRNTISCGCSRVIHGATGTPTYNTWSNMQNRATSRNHIAFHNYGGRGIRICKRWQRFENFLADMGPRPPGHSIDRFPDVNGNYEPGNCRWATMSQQQNNRRNTKAKRGDKKC